MGNSRRLAATTTITAPSLREQRPGTKFDSIRPRKGESFLGGYTKAIVNFVALNRPSPSRRPMGEQK
jgi:hypothetical protein